MSFWAVILSSLLGRLWPHPPANPPTVANEGTAAVASEEFTQETLNLADLVSIHGIGALLVHQLPVLDRVRLRGLSRELRVLVDESLTPLTRLSGEDLMDVTHGDNWADGLLWLWRRCPNLHTFIAGGAPEHRGSQPPLLLPGPASERDGSQYDVDSGLVTLDGNQYNQVDNCLPVELNYRYGKRNMWTERTMCRVLLGIAPHCGNIRHLDLVGCAGVITDYIVIQLIGRAPQLQLLDLSYCKRVTDASLVALAAYCPALRHLLLRSTRVSSTGVRAISAGCPDLLTLDVSRCGDVTDASLAAVAVNCQHLLRLGIVGTGVTVDGLTSVLRDCAQLESLHCDPVEGFPAANARGGVRQWMRVFSSSSAAAGVATTSAVPHRYSWQWGLRHLYIRHSRVFNDAALAAFLENCPLLESLMIPFHQGVTDAGIIARNCPLLRHLDASNTGVTDDGISALAARCPWLNHLDLARTKVTGSSVKQVATYCQQLQFLNVSGCGGVGPDAIHTIGDNCPGLRSLGLAGCDAVDDASICTVAYGCPQLRSLNISRTLVSDAGFAAVLQNCWQLRHLAMRQSVPPPPCLLTDAPFLGPPAATDGGDSKASHGGVNCTRLEHLDIGFSPRLTDRAISALAARCMHLRSLVVWGCGSITDVGLATVVAMFPQLRYLNMQPIR